MEEALALLFLRPQTLYKQSTKVSIQASWNAECGMATWRRQGDMNGDMAVTRRHGKRRGLGHDKGEMTTWRRQGDMATRSGTKAGIRIFVVICDLFV